MTNVRILPYDESSEHIFELAKKQITSILGDVEVVHRGSSRLKIPGQDEIDVYIPLSRPDLPRYVELSVAKFGTPRNAENLERVRFLMTVNEKKIDLFLIDNECEDWKKGLAFEKYLSDNPEALKKYAQLKEELNGATKIEYYEKKDSFIEMILQNLFQ